MRTALCQLVVNYAKEEMMMPSFGFVYNPHTNPSGYTSILHMEADMTDYLERLEQGFECSSEAFVVAAVFIMRLRTQVLLTRLSLRECVLAVLSLATKFLDDDDTRSPGRMCAYAGNVSVHELYTMEVVVLQLMQWRLFVTQADYARVRVQLESLWVQKYVPRPYGPPHSVHDPMPVHAPHGSMPEYTAMPPPYYHGGMLHHVNSSGFLTGFCSYPPVARSTSHMVPSMPAFPPPPLPPPLPLCVMDSPSYMDPGHLAPASRVIGPSPPAHVHNVDCGSIGSTCGGNACAPLYPAQSCATWNMKAVCGGGGDAGCGGNSDSSGAGAEDWMQFINCSSVDFGTWPSAVLSRTPPVESLPTPPQCKQQDALVPPPIRLI